MCFVLEKFHPFVNIFMVLKTSISPPPLFGVLPIVRGSVFHEYHTPKTPLLFKEGYAVRRGVVVTECPNDGLARRTNQNVF